MLDKNLTKVHFSNFVRQDIFLGKELNMQTQTSQQNNPFPALSGIKLSGIEDDLCLVLQKIGAIDLGPIKFKLMHEYGWTQDKIEATEINYRRYLMLVAIYPRKTIVPNKIVDEMWHAHILDTAKYRKDCQETFGYFLDHFPYLGLRGKEDKIRLAESFSETNQLYQIHFGENLIGVSAECSATSCTNGTCMSACGHGQEEIRPVYS